MNISILYALFFVISYFIGLSGFLFLKKSDKVLSVMTWFPLTIVTFMGYHTFINGCLKICDKPFFIPFLGIADLMIGIICWYLILKNKTHQKYEMNHFDAILCFMFLIVTVFFANQEFSLNLNLGYITSDPGVHFGLAMDALRDGSTTGMFFSEINNALFIGVFAPFLSSIVYCYKIFVLSDILMFLLSGFMLYALVRDLLRGRLSRLFCVMLIIIYMAGYPLSNMLYGFVYLGMSVSLIAYAMILTKIYIDEDIYHYLNYILLGISVLSIVLCYMLFAPIVWLSVFSCIAYCRYKKTKLFSLETVIIMLIIFMIPTLMAIRFCFFEYFVARDLDITSAISNAGGIYKDLYSNFVLLLPFALFGIVENLKRKKAIVEMIYMTLFLSFVLVMFILMYQGTVSEYYFSKTYYPLWLIYFVFVIQGMNYFTEYPKSIMISILSIFAIMVGIDKLNIERKIIVNHPTFTVEKSQTFLDIYSYNLKTLNLQRFYDDQLIKLYQFTIDECIPKSSKPIPVYVSLSNYQDWYWFESLSGMDSSMFYTWDIGEFEIQKKILNGEADYVIVKYDDPMYQKNPLFFQNYEVVYSNDAGCIYSIK